MTEAEVTTVSCCFRSCGNSKAAERHRPSTCCVGSQANEGLRNVYLTVLSQFILPMAATTVFTFVEPVRLWGYGSWAFLISSVVIFLALFITLTILLCCQKVKCLTRFPGSLLCLIIYSISFSHVCAAAASISIGLAVMAALTITMLSCLAGIILSLQTTLKPGTTLAFLGLLLGYAAMATTGCLLVHFYMPEDPSDRQVKIKAYICISFGGIVGVAMSLFLFYCTPKSAYGSMDGEEVILAALQLYLMTTYICFGSFGGDE